MVHFLHLFQEYGTRAEELLVDRGEKQWSEGDW